MSLEQARAAADVARASIAEKLRRTRNLYVRTIAHDRKKRAAWDRLCPRVNWKIAAQDFTTCLLPDGTEAPLFLDEVDRAFPNMHQPEFIIPIANGFAPDLSDPNYDSDGDPVRQLVQSINDHAPPADGTDDDAGIDIDEATARIRRAHGLGDFVPEQQSPGQDDELAGD